MYSLVCKRCGRKLKSEISRRRGYGPACYRKIGSDEKKDTEEPKYIEKIEQVKQLDGQLDIEDVLYEMS